MKNLMDKLISIDRTNNIKPLVSIIIATFNSEQTLPKALESVISQDFQDWECIIVDGQSSDKTISIVKEYTKKDIRISYISEKDKGIYDAFNKGWQLAKGEWIYYLGSDDYLTKESFTLLLKGDIHKYDVISGNCWIHKIDGSIKKQTSNGYSGCHQAKITRKSAIEKMNGFNLKYKIFADFDLYMRMEKEKFRVKNIETMVAHFSMDGTSQKLSNIWKCNKEYRAIYNNNNQRYGIFQEIKYCLYTSLSIIYRWILKFIKKKY